MTYTFEELKTIYWYLKSLGTDDKSINSVRLQVYSKLLKAAVDL